VAQEYKNTDFIPTKYVKVCNKSLSLVLSTVFGSFTTKSMCQTPRESMSSAIASYGLYIESWKWESGSWLPNFILKPKIMGSTEYH